MKKNMYFRVFVIISVIMGIIAVFAGCGGGGSNLPTNGGTGLEPQTPGNPSVGASGTFTVKMVIPENIGGNLESKVIPYRANTLRITITGESITTPIVSTTNISAGGTQTITIQNIPVGLDIAKMEVLASDGSLLAERHFGFFMSSGATVGPGTIDMGIAIGSDGSYNPPNIDIPVGTILYFENDDYNTDRTATLSGGITVGPIPKAVHAVQPNTPDKFSAMSHTFSTVGTFTFPSGGRVVVYNPPTLTAITNDPNAPAVLQIRDDKPSGAPLNFILTGTNFGTDQAGVNGTVSFIRKDDPNHPVTPATVTSWSDTKIVGTIPNLSVGTFLVQVSVRGIPTTNLVYYYRETWQALGTPRFSIGISQAFYFLVRDNAGTPDSFVSYIDGADAAYRGVYHHFDTTKTPPDWDSAAGLIFSDFLPLIAGDTVYNLFTDGNPSSTFLRYDNGLGVIQASSAHIVKRSVPAVNELYATIDGIPGATVPSPVDNPAPVPVVAYTFTAASIQAYDATHGYVACIRKDTLNAKDIPRVYVYQTANAINWSLLGAGNISVADAKLPTLFIFPGDPLHPYVAFQDNANQQGTTVMQYTGAGYYGGWALVGSQGFSAGVANAISLFVYNDPIDGAVPYIAYQDSTTGANNITVRKFVGFAHSFTGWEVVGQAGFGTGKTDLSLFVYNDNGKAVPYVAYSENNGNVMKFDGTNWVQVGQNGFGSGTVASLSLSVYNNGGIPEPFIGYQDTTINQKATVMRLQDAPIVP